MTRTYFDVTLPYSEILPAWPGEPQPKITKLSDMAMGGAANVTHVSACVHFGTHVDAPVHFVPGRAGVDEIEPERMIGEAWVVDGRGYSQIDSAFLEQAEIPKGAEQVIFRTDNSALWDKLDHPFNPDFVAVTPDGAEWLVDAGVTMVGVDYLSVESFHTVNFDTHKILLGAGVFVVEGLDLRFVESGAYGFACLPMKIVGADGAPARVLLWRDDE